MLTLYLLFIVSSILIALCTFRHKQIPLGLPEIKKIIWLQGNVKECLGMKYVQCHKFYTLKSKFQHSGRLEIYPSADRIKSSVGHKAILHVVENRKTFNPKLPPPTRATPHPGRLIS